MLPIGLILLLLTGIGPLLAWRKSTAVESRRSSSCGPLAAVRDGGVRVYALGVRVWSVGDLLRALRVRRSSRSLQEFIRGAQVRKGATGTDILTAMIGLVGRSRRRYGGYIVHVGIMLMFLGFAGQGFKQEEQVLLQVGQQTTVGPFTIRHDALTVTSDAQKQMITGHVSVFDERQADRHDVAGAVVLRQARSRSRRPKWRFAARRPRICTSCSAGYDVAHAGGDLRDRHQSAGELDLVRLRR